MTGAELFLAVAGFVVMLFGAAFSVWKYVDGKVASVREDAQRRSDEISLRSDASVSLANEATAKVSRDLADHKLHAAETFATKAGMQEQTAQIMKAIESVVSRIDGISDRLDRWYDSRGG